MCGLIASDSNDYVLTPMGFVAQKESDRAINLSSGYKFIRGCDIMHQSEANTSCKKLYLLVQIVYLSDDNFEAETQFMKHAIVIIESAPSMSTLIAMIYQLMQQQCYHEALRCARELVAYETTVLERVMGKLDDESNVRH